MEAAWKSVSGVTDFLAVNVSEAVAASPDDLAVVEKGDADAGNFVVRHAVGDSHRRWWLAFDDHGGEKTVFNAGNSRGQSGVPGRLLRACRDDCAE